MNLTCCHGNEDCGWQKYCGNEIRRLTVIAYQLRFFVQLLLTNCFSDAV